MLDIHPPHSPTHTWKDFFIHIATICVGLLIAIGLEQGVELLHHRRQATRLEEDMRTEAAQNLRIIESDFAKDLPRLAWEGAAMRVLRDAPLQHGAVLVVLPPAPPGHPLNGYVTNTTPSHSVWTIAQSTGQVDLLPLERAKVYDRLERGAAEFLRIATIADVESTEFHGVLRSLNVNFDPGETLQLTSAQRDELVRAVNRDAEMYYWVLVRLAFWRGASKAVFDGVQDADGILRYLDKEHATIQQP